MSDDLKPCPFCGSSNVVSETTITDGAAWCFDCRAKIVREHENLYTEDGRALAIDAWNSRAEKAERGAAVTVRQAAKVLLDASGDWWPSQEAKQAAISAYTLKNGKCRPVALTDAWHAALNALKEPDT